MDKIIIARKEIKKKIRNGDTEEWRVKIGQKISDRKLMKTSCLKAQTFAAMFSSIHMESFSPLHIQAHL